YRWSNGESGRSIEVSESGEYWVEVIDELGCTSRSEIIRIEVIQGSPVGIMAMPADSAFRSVPPNLICRDIRLRNLTDSPQTLGFADVYLSNNINFTIPAGQLPMTLAPGAQADLTICFSADKQGELRDTLNLFIATGCGQQVPLLGYGIAEGGTAGSKCGMTIRTGFRELEVFPRVEISPNPASGSAEIRLALAEEDDFCNIKIMNIFGKVLDRIACKSGNHILDTRQYDDGVYFLHFSGKNYAFTRKIIIIK
ncbi:MAG: T9SS type A sorting domain-containing protein, partial [Candidatus Kapaibacterium sp.]